MLFSKPKTSAIPTAQKGAWADVERRHQDFRVEVQRVQFCVSGSWGGLGLEVQGMTKVQALAGYLVVVSFEILEPFETPGRLRKTWSECPESVEGTCEAQEQTSPSDVPRFNVTLFCQQKAADTIQRTLHFASGQQVSAVLDIQIDFPGAAVPAFWSDAWRSKELRVRNWRLIAETTPSGGGA